MANDKRKTKAQLIAELEEMRQRLEQQAEQARRERAVERVRAEATSMRQGNDLRNVIGVVMSELIALGVDTELCLIQFPEPKNERVRFYGAVINAKKRGVFWAASSPRFIEINEDVVVEGPLENLLDDHIAMMWKKGETYWTSGFTENVQNIGEYLGRQLKVDGSWPFSKRECIRVDVRFEYGWIGVCVPGFNENLVEIVQEFCRGLELGYLRFLDFQRLEEQNQTLAEANQQIEENTRRKSDFLARMSHDLRTPMNAIIGYTRILLRRCRDTLESRQLRNLENIDTSAHNLLNLINEILDLSKVEAGRIEVRPQPVDLQQLATECAAAIEPLIQAEVQLVQDIEAVPSLRTDGEILRKVLMNLLGNAVKFTDAGSITVSVQPVDDQVEISIADTGMGIPPEDLPYIFEEFRQVERQGSTEKEGTGLGLAIAKKSVELLGGTISAESEVGKGTVFTLRIKDYPSE